MLLIVSQNREQIYNLSGHIEGLKYEEAYDYMHTAKGKKRKETARQTIQVVDGYAEEIAEYDTKEDCLDVLQLLTLVVQNSDRQNIVFTMPTKEELKKGFL